MSWRESAGIASFRGVPFELEEASGEGGRRLVVHEYPTREDHATEDLGRSARRLTIAGFVAGEDVARRLARLLAAAEAPGPGILVHPYRGRLACRVESVSEVVRSSEGGVARFTLQLVEDGSTVAPLLSTARIPAVSTAAADARTASRVRFVALFRRGLPSYAGDAFAANVADATLVAVDVLASVAALLSRPYYEVRALLDASDLALRTIETGGATAAALAVDAFLGALRPWKAIEAFLLAAASAQPPAPGPAGVAWIDDVGVNLELLERLNRRLGIAHAAEALVAEPFRGREDVLGALDAFLAFLDTEIDEGGDDGEVRALSRLRVDVHVAVSSLAAALPGTRTIDLPAPISAVLLAGALYGDATRADDLADRAAAVHLGFLSGRFAALAE